jgi:hypothetical protein
MIVQWRRACILRGEALRAALWNDPRSVCWSVRVSSCRCFCTDCADGVVGAAVAVAVAAAAAMLLCCIVCGSATAQSEFEFPDLTSGLLEKMVQYMHYKVRDARRGRVRWRGSLTTMPTPSVVDAYAG